MPTPDEPRPGYYCSPEEYQNALRTLQIHDNRPALHASLHQLENDVIDLLKPEDRERFRSET